jgi:hypothetical protein
MVGYLDSSVLLRHILLGDAAIKHVQGLTLAPESLYLERLLVAKYSHILVFESFRLHLQAGHESPLCSALQCLAAVLLFSTRYKMSRAVPAISERRNISGHTAVTPFSSINHPMTIGPRANPAPIIMGRIALNLPR